MTKGGKMIFFFLAGCVCFIVAVWVYTRAEDNSMVKFERAATVGEVEAKKANVKCEALDESIKTLGTQFEELKKAIEDADAARASQLEHLYEVNRQAMAKSNGELEIIKVRQHTLDKKILGIDKTVNLELSSKPIQIEIVSTPTPAPAPKAKVPAASPKKDPLLKRSGVTP